MVDFVLQKQQLRTAASPESARAKVSLSLSKAPMRSVLPIVVPVSTTPAVAGPEWCLTTRPPRNRILPDPHLASYTQNSRVMDKGSRPLTMSTDVLHLGRRQCARPCSSNRCTTVFRKRGNVGSNSESLQERCQYVIEAKDIAYLGLGLDGTGTSVVHRAPLSVTRLTYG